MQVILILSVTAFLSLFHVARAEESPGFCDSYTLEKPVSSPTGSDPKDTKLKANIPYGSGLLWQISAENNKNSYIFGTMHSQDRLVTDIPPPVRLKIVKSRLYVMEVFLDDQANRIFSERIFFNDHNRLDVLLNQDVYQKLSDKITDYGITEERLPFLKPWAAFTLVGRPKPVNAQTQDIKLMQIAQSANLEITALETMHELLTVLDGIALDDQIEILNDTICNHQDILRQAKDIRDMYIAGDLAGIISLNNQPHHNEAVFNRYIEQILFDRNVRMSMKIKQLVRQGNVFIAVGASHLPGEKGILNRLGQAGFVIKRVY